MLDLLGSIWLFLGPVILLSIYTFIYAIVFRIRPEGMSLVDYIIYIFCGLVSYLGFSGGLSVGVTSLSSNKQLLLNTVFPTELLPLRSVLAGSTVIVFGFSIIACALLLLSKLSITILLIPFVIVLQLMFVIGLCWILSLINLVVRDIQQFIGYVLMLLLIMSPISYTPTMIPSSLKMIIYANPLSYYVLCYQNIILMGKLPSLSIITVCIAQSFFVFSLGFWVFQRTKKLFFDYA